MPPSCRPSITRPDALAIRGDRRRFDRRVREVDFRAAVRGLIDVRVGLQFVRSEISRGGRINWLGEGQLEPVRFGPHLVNLERGLCRVQSSRSSAYGLLPRLPQPRLVPPMNIAPVGDISSVSVPEPKPSRNGKHAP